MFQADSDFYQQYEAADSTWQTTEQVIQGEELLFRREGEEEANDGTQAEEAPTEEEEEEESQTETAVDDVQICDSQTQWCCTGQVKNSENASDIKSHGLFLQIACIAQVHIMLKL